VSQKDEEITQRLFERASYGRRREFGGAFVYGVYKPGESVKMDTGHPVEGSSPFGNEFPSICNHCGVMAA